MSQTEATIKPVNYFEPSRLKNHLPPPLLPAYSAAQIRKESAITAKEKLELRKLRNQIDQAKQKFKQGEVVSLTQLKEKLETNTPNAHLDVLTQLIAWFERTQGIEFHLYETQLLALLRLFEHYHQENSTGLITELATSGGKSSVLIPIWTTYLSLHEAQVQVHTVNPYLVEELTRFITDFMDTLIESDEAKSKQALLVETLPSAPETPEKAKIQEKILKNLRQTKIVVGHWTNFIHAYQNGLIDTNAHVVLDEIDAILQDEAPTPAVITQNQPTDGVINNLTKYLQEYQIGLSLSDFPKNLQEKLTLKDEADLLTKLYLTLKAFKDQDPNITEVPQGRQITQIETFNYWQKALGVNLLKWFGGKPFEKYLEEKNQALNLEFYESLASTFWFDDPELVLALATALTLKRGTDYEVTQDPETGKLMVKPLANTGYLEIGKQFGALVQLALLLKEMELDQDQNLVEAIKAHLPDTLTEEIPADSLDTVAFYQLFPKISGFTASVSPVARRLKEVYDLDTTIVDVQSDSEKQKERKEVVKLAENKEGALSQALEMVLTDKRNTLFVVKSIEEAEAVRQAIEQTSNDQIEVEILTANNMADDRQLYQWLGERDAAGKRRVLVSARMVGRGVDIKPKEKVQEEGLLLVSTWMPDSERAYLQLVGRVARNGVPGETWLYFYPDSDIAQYLNSSQQEKFTIAIKSKDHPTAIKLIRQAWKRRENQLTEYTKHLSIFNRSLNFTRQALRQTTLEELLRPTPTKPSLGTKLKQVFKPDKKAQPAPKEPRWLANNLERRFLVLLKLYPGLWGQFVADARNVFILKVSNFSIDLETTWQTHLKQLKKEYLSFYTKKLAEYLDQNYKDPHAIQPKNVFITQAGKHLVVTEYKNPEGDLRPEHTYIALEGTASGTKLQYSVEELIEQVKQDKIVWYFKVEKPDTDDSKNQIDIWKLTPSLV